MDFKIVITESATSDLEQIVEYIASDNPTAAQRVGEIILEKFQGLKRFPFMRRMVPEWGQSEWGELIYLSYRLISTSMSDARLSRLHASGTLPEENQDFIN